MPSPTPSPSPSASVSPSPNGLDADPTPVFGNPVMLFYQSYAAGTKQTRADFCAALSFDGGADALIALMDVSSMDACVSRGQQSAGRLLYDGSAYSGTLEAAEKGTGTILGDAAPYSFTFSFENGDTLYGSLKEHHLGYMILDGAHELVSMVRIAENNSVWTVCTDENGVRTVSEWGEDSRFASFPFAAPVYLPAATENPDAAWDAPVLEPSFVEENWYDFTWDALTEDATSVYTFRRGSLALLPAA